LAISLIVVLVTIFTPVLINQFIIPSFKEQIINNVLDNTRKIAYRISQEINFHTSTSDDISKSIEIDLNTFNIFKIHYMNKDGKILYSTQKEKIGTFHDHPHFYETVSQGKSYYVIKSKGDLTHEDDGHKHDIIEIYVPIMKDGKFYSTFELYYDITKEINEFNSLSDKIMKIIVSTSLIVLILFLITIYNASKNNLRLINNHKRFKELANSDSLTGLYNRRYFYHLANKILKLTSRSNSPISVCMIDIDNFKSINDTYGHHLGDFVIKNLSKNLLEFTRDSDIVARYGGEEFIILFPDTDINGARVITNKICKKIAEQKLESQNSNLSYTVSIGVSEYKHNSHIDEFIINADNALYKAKDNGKNQVVIS